jgi:hypothetical protein
LSLKIDIKINESIMIDLIRLISYHFCWPCNKVLHNNEVGGRRMQGLGMLLLIRSRVSTTSKARFEVATRHPCHRAGYLSGEMDRGLQISTGIGLLLSASCLKIPAGST